MKNRLYILLPLLLLTSCGNNSNSESVANSSQINSSSSIVESVISSSSVDYSAKAKELLDELVGLNITIAKIDFKATKDGKQYLSEYTYRAYDKTKNIVKEDVITKRPSTIDETIGSISKSVTTYYDGTCSYTLDSDDMYIKEANKMTLTYYSLPYKLEKLTNFVINGNHLTADLANEDVNYFFNKEVSNTSDVKIDYYKDSIDTELKVYYKSNGFDITVSIKIDTTEVNLSLPESKYIKNS